MTHLAIAKEINETIHISTDLPQFYIGSIAPDSVHFRENYHGDMKKQSHYNPNNKPWGNMSSVEECDEWLEYVLPKLNAPGNQPHSDFYWGCLVHILSDIWNTRENFIKYREWCIIEDVPKDAYFNEQRNNDLFMFNDVEWKDEVWTHLSKARGETVSNIIKSDEVIQYRDYVFNTYVNSVTEPNYSKVYMTSDDNYEFIKNSAKEICKLINELR